MPKDWLAPAELRKLRRLVRFRQQQKVNERRNSKLRLRALLHDHLFLCIVRQLLGWPGGAEGVEDGDDIDDFLHNCAGDRR